MKVIAKTETGINELVNAIDKHQAFIRQKDNWNDYRYLMAKKTSRINCQIHDV